MVGKLYRESYSDMGVGNIEIIIHVEYHDLPTTDLQWIINNVRKPFIRKFKHLVGYQKLPRDIFGIK